MFIKHMKEESKITYEKFEENKELGLEDLEISPYTFECTYGIPGYKVSGTLNLLGNKKEFTTFHLPIPSRIIHRIGYEYIDYFLKNDCEASTSAIPKKNKLYEGRVDYEIDALKKYINLFSVGISDLYIQDAWDQYKTLMEYIPLLLYFKGYLNPHRVGSYIKHIPFLHSSVSCNESDMLFLMAEPIIFIDKPKRFLEEAEYKILRFYQEEEESFSTLDYRLVISEYVSRSFKFRDIEIKYRSRDSHKVERLDRVLKRTPIGYGRDNFLNFRINHPSSLETIFKLMTHGDRIKNIQEEFIERVIDFIKDHNSKE